VTSKEKYRRCFTSPGIALAFFAPWVSIALYVLVAVLWLVPDPRIENLIDRE
jgi:hypothetical protein